MATVAIVCSRCGEDVSAEDVHKGGPAWHRACEPAWIAELRREVDRLQALIEAAPCGRYATGDAPPGADHAADQGRPLTACDGCDCWKREALAPAEATTEATTEAADPGVFCGLCGAICHAAGPLPCATFRTPPRIGCGHPRYSGDGPAAA